MNHSNDVENSEDGGWLSKVQVAGLSTVISSIYDQTLLLFSRSAGEPEDDEQSIGEHDFAHGAEASAGLDDMLDRVQHAGWNVIQRAQVLGSPSRVEVEREVQNALLRLGIPSRERVEKISRELDELNALLDQLLAERSERQETAQNEEE